ncbi:MULTISPECIES: hypothetical protein [unclassified Oceanispirochaeta]|uniref:hypothetical protein n=1 Tax=unclassified Oceanispirochaeta TaxID=2635722 RepID=UPI001313FCD6|nr:MULTISPECIES: hypothetical protein [unclassified Oceanispirochaeta]MBF9014659.1 hypothetical protein [Oceanispirochaeta sp. M2]NPD70915.1 hypothetical protein [Oceanispirochaeta sp. M1]
MNTEWSVQKKRDLEMYEIRELKNDLNMESDPFRREGMIKIKGIPKPQKQF